METKTLVAKARSQSEVLRLLRRDLRSVRVLGFLVSKGLLFAPDIRPKPSIKLSIPDVLWVGENVEPRVIEVLPAALIAFPKTFLRQSELPAELQEIVKRIRSDEPFSIRYAGIEYDKMRHWAKEPRRDRRVRPVGVKKRPRTFRFSPSAITALSEKAKKSGLTETAYLENLILGSEN